MKDGAAWVISSFITLNGFSCKLLSLRYCICRTDDLTANLKDARGALLTVKPRFMRQQCLTAFVTHVFVGDVAYKTEYTAELVHFHIEANAINVAVVVLGLNSEIRIGA